MKELNYSEYRDKIINILKDARCIILATSENNRVTTRLVSPIQYGTSILFSTQDGSKKIRQIRANEKVAFAYNGINVEAKAVIFGHPLRHPTFMKDYCDKFPELVEAYGCSPDSKEEDSPEDILVISEMKSVEIFNFQNMGGWLQINFEEEKACWFE